MFCTKCGNQLPDDTRFCTFCGAPQEAEPAAAVAPETEPVVPETETVAPEAALAEDSIINVVAEEEATYDVPFIATDDFTPPERTPAPKKKKTGLIVAIILVVVLLAGAAVGVYFYLDHKNSTAYEAATAMLEAGDINGALAAFEELGEYEDSAKIAKKLQKYQQALTHLDAHEYNEAMELFNDLGKFHDAKTYVECGVTYHKASYLMACAEKADPAGLAVLYDGAAPSFDSSSDISKELYYRAAELFESLGDYNASPMLFSECWYNLGIIAVDSGNIEGALNMVHMLNDDHAAALQAAIEAAAADATFLEDLQTALRIWLDEEEVYTLEDEIQKACEHLAVYEELYFLDAELRTAYDQIMAALNLQLEAVASGDEVEDWVQMYQGMADLYTVCDQLYEKNGFCEGTELKDSVIGLSAIAYKYPIIEESLEKQLSGITAPWDDKNDYYYAPYTNDTGFEFTLEVVIEFYMGNELKETGKAMTFIVLPGNTIQIPLKPATLKDGEFDGWTPIWEFTPNG